MQDGFAVGQVKILNVHALIGNTKLIQTVAYVKAKLASDTSYKYFHSFSRFPYIFS